MRRVLLATTAFFFAGNALAAPDALTRAEARHLVARTGFGAAPAEIDALVGRSAEEAVAGIIAGLRTEPSRPMPAWTRAWAYPEESIWTLDSGAQDLFFNNRYAELEELSAWWIGEMIATPSPLTERLTLFWHDHFATSFDAFENSQTMANQHAMLRRHSAGDFADLAQGILRDPAMLIYLTNMENRADAPNENLGREFLELFTLGEGRGYTEADVKEAARALTGHTIGEDGRFAIYEDEHDGGRKTILGERGRFDGEDLARVVLESEAFGPYVVEKLWRTFVSPTPDAGEVARLTALWKVEGLDVKPLLEALFLTDAFWDPANRGTLIKSPVELIAGTVRATGRAGLPLDELSWRAEEMGQALFFPPNVAGWAGGAAWINDATAGLRAAALQDFASSFEEDFEVEAPAMKMGAPEHIMTETPEGSLRVGRVFGRWAVQWDDVGGMGRLVSVQLFDVSFGPDTFRSLDLEIEAAADGALFVHLLLGTCAPLCEGLEGEDGWLTLSVEDGRFEAEESVDQRLRDILAASFAHLPELLEETRESRAWRPDPEVVDESALPFEDVVALAKRLPNNSDAPLLRTASRPGADGLGGIDPNASEAMLAAFYEGQYARSRRLSSPPWTYETAEDWLAALPDADAAAAEALLALPVVDTGDAHDADDLLERLLLSPAYQVN